MPASDSPMAVMDFDAVLLHPLPARRGRGKDATDAQSAAQQAVRETTNRAIGELAARGTHDLALTCPGEALPPSARYERRVGVSLVRAAWERRPEGPAYLLSICDAPISRRPVCFLMHTLTPLDQWNSERVFPEFLRFRTRLL